MTLQLLNGNMSLYRVLDDDDPRSHQVLSAGKKKRIETQYQGHDGLGQYAVRQTWMSYWTIDVR